MRNSIPPADRAQRIWNPGRLRYNIDTYLLLRASFPGPDSSPDAQFGYILQSLRYNPLDKTVVYSGSQDKNGEPCNTVESLLEVFEACAVNLKVDGANLIWDQDLAIGIGPIR